MQVPRRGRDHRVEIAAGYQAHVVFRAARVAFRLRAASRRDHCERRVQAVGVDIADGGDLDARHVEQHFHVPAATIPNAHHPYPDRLDGRRKRCTKASRAGRLQKVSTAKLSHTRTSSEAVIRRGPARYRAAASHP